MKINFTLLGTLTFFILFNFNCKAQWQTQGPFGGPINALITISANVFTGTGNGVFKSTDDGKNWSAVNTGIERKNVLALAVNSNNIFAGTTSDGVYLSSDEGRSWTVKNNGLTNFNIISLFSSGNKVFAGTADGVFYTADNGNSWTVANSGIPATYPIYCFAQSGTTIFGGTYGLGLYSTNNNGGSWTSVGGGFPANTFVYALIADASRIYAGTSNGVYLSADGGVSWSLSNTGFPSGKWAQCFSVKSGYVFAGTFSEGVFVSTNNGSTWTQMDSGLPDLPIPTGLPHNYPSVQSLAVSGQNVIAATWYGMYLTSNNATLWSESNTGILSNDVTAITANNNIILAGTDRTGVYVSTDKGASWSRSDNGLTSVNVLALTTTNSNAFVSLSNAKVFRSTDNGVSWTLSSNGLPAPAGVLKADSSRVVALTIGLQYTPPAIFQTHDNGANWTSIPTTGFNVIDMSAMAVNGQSIYVGTTTGNLSITTNDGLNWQSIRGSLPSSKINAILTIDSVLFVGTEGKGVYKSADHGSSWTQVNSGLSNNFVRDLIIQNNKVYASTWGGGIFVSNNMGISWTAFNTGLGDLFVRNLTGDGTMLFAGTDIGAYSNSMITIGVKTRTPSQGIEIFPNPAPGSFYISNPGLKPIKVSVCGVNGQEIYHFDGDPKDFSNIDLTNQPKGIYFLYLQTETGTIVKKLVLK